MMRRLYDWMMAKARSERAPHALFWVAFIESSFFPIPPDVMLIPMVIANRLKAWWYATVATIGSVIGGVFGYLIGYFFFEQIGRPILEFYGKAESFGQFTSWFNDWGVWILIIKGMTPFPYKVLTITAGVTHMPLVEFMLASVIARAMRFYLVAGLLYFFGEPIREFIEKRLNVVTTVFIVLLVLGFVAIRYVF
ncbi:YqaA family protein [Hyphomicrobium sp.]|uniref:YqaA family protein n=1 Tax=Hyphomicrobium sp. TaxID=82 RepID=UPI002FE316E0